MIATLNGIITEKNIDDVVIECSGVGYGVIVSNQDHHKLVLGSAKLMYIYENIKEDSHDLYGFVDKKSKSLFSLLISVNGVGPKAAMAILNISEFNSLVRAIGSGDVKFIAQAKGVGPKAAQKVVLDLKDKLSLFGEDSSTDFESIMNSSVKLNDEATQALIALGYNQGDALDMLKSIDKDLSTEERIRLALRG